jgi:hypothetical protein
MGSRGRYTRQRPPRTRPKIRRVRGKHEHNTQARRRSTTKHVLLTPCALAAGVRDTWVMFCSRLARETRDPCSAHAFSLQRSSYVACMEHAPSLAMAGMLGSSDRAAPESSRSRLWVGKARDGLSCGAACNTAETSCTAPRSPAQRLPGCGRRLVYHMLRCRSNMGWLTRKGPRAWRSEAPRAAGSSGGAGLHPGVVHESPHPDCEACDV